MHHLTPTELKNLIDVGEKPFLLDVRETWEYEICALPKSTNIPMSRIPAWLNEISPEEHIVVICHHGMRSLNVAQFLTDNGYQAISNLKGGIHAWAIEVDPSMEQY